ncbi:MAG: LysR family transcriptional regulator [Terracidiphilus sp.]
MNNWAEFRHFKYVLAIIEHMGLRAAAEHLRTAEPNLSVQAKQFQENLAIQLFRRAKDGRIQLTKTGIAFKPIAQGLLDAREEAIAALVAIERGQICTLNLGCAPFVDPELFQMVCEMHKEIVPDCSIRPTHGDTVQLVEELVSGQIDAAIMTLPISDPRLYAEAIRRDRLVACLPANHSLASKMALRPADLQGTLAVLCHPQQHPEAHAQLMAWLGEGGIHIEEFARASHPTEMQTLVKAGYGLALIREGIVLDAGLTTRPIIGVNWVVDTAFVHNRQVHPKTVPVLLRNLKRRLAVQPNKARTPEVIAPSNSTNGGAKRPPGSENYGQSRSSNWPPGMKAAG